MRPPHLSRPARTWPFAHVLGALAFGTALGACFNPPAAATMFACDAEDAPACPAGYSCEADGCCHRAGTDVAAEYGACGLGGGPGGMTGPPPTGSSGDVSSSGADATLTEATGTASTSATGSTTSGADTGSSDAGTTATGSSDTGSSDTGSSSASTGP